MAIKIIRESVFVFKGIQIQGIVPVVVHKVKKNQLKSVMTAFKCSI